MAIPAVRQVRCPNQGDVLYTDMALTEMGDDFSFFFLHFFGERKIQGTRVQSSAITSITLRPHGACLGNFLYRSAKPAFHGLKPENINSSGIVNGFCLFYIIKRKRCTDMAHNPRVSRSSNFHHMMLQPPLILH
jgi:hypothetical protein